MSMPWQSRLIASAVLSAGMFVLAACTTPSDSTDPSDSSAPHSGEHPGSTEPGAPGSPSDSPSTGEGSADEAQPGGASSGVEPAAVKLPETCAELVPADSLIPELQPFDDRANSWASAMIDPKTYAAVMAGEPRLKCGWGMPESDVIAVVAVSAMTPNAKKVLTKSLEASTFEDASAKYDESQLSFDVAYERPPTKDAPYMSTVLIEGPVLVAVSQTAQGDFAGEALRTVQRLNRG